MRNNKNVNKLTTTLFIITSVLTGCNIKTEKEKQYNVVAEKDNTINIDYDKKITDIVVNGATNYKIVYSSNAGDAVIEGAKEIKQMIYDSTKVFINIVTDEGLTYNDSSYYISLGQNKILQKSNLVFNYTGLKHDAFIMKTAGNSLFIDGVSDRGTLYGAYDFCERFIGVRYLTYSQTYCPSLENITLYETDIVSNPAFEDRCFMNRKFYDDYKYMSRMRCIHEYRDIPDMYGGNIGWFSDNTFVKNYVHNTLDYVEPDLYLHSHPEWFFVSDGNVCDLHYSHVGLNEDGTINQSLNESPVKIAIERLKEFILNSDDLIKYYMIGQMDLNYTCQCQDCVAQEAKYGRSGMNIRFVNAIYDEVSKWAKQNGINKEWYLCSFAYQWSQSAPVKKVNGEYVALDSTVLPRDNVIVRIAPIQADNYYGMIDERQNERTREMLLGWKAILKEIR